MSVYKKTGLDSSNWAPTRSIRVAPILVPPRGVHPLVTGGICRLLESRVLRSGRAAAGSGSRLMCLMLFCDEAVREAMH